MRRGYRRTAVVATVYLGLAVVAFWNLWTSAGPVNPAGSGGDSSASVWFLTYWPWALLHGHLSLATNVANAPYGVNLMDNTSAAFPALLVMPVTLLAGPLPGYYTAMTLSVALSGLACYALLRRLTGWWGAAFAGGLVFELSGYVVGQASEHLNLAFVAIVPLFGLVIHELLAPRRSWRPEILGVVLAGLAIAQFFTSSEVLLTTMVTAALTVLVAALVARAGQRPVRAAAERLGRAVAVAAVVGGAVLAYPIWFTVAGSQSTKGLPGGARDFGADLAALVVPSRLQVLAPSWAVHVASHFVGGGLGENGAYLGAPLVLTCAAGAIWLWRRPVVKVAAVMMVASLVLSLGPTLSVDGPTDLPGVGHGVWLPERLLYDLPFGSEVKTVRFSLFTAIFAAVILAAVLDELRTRLATRRSAGAPNSARRRLLVVALAAACLVPLVPAWPYGTQPVPVPSFFTTAAVRTIPPGSTVLLYPFPVFSDDNAAAMVWQSDAFMRFRIVGGYFILNDGRGAVFFNRISATYVSLMSAYEGHPRPLSPAVRAAMDGELAAWNVSVVVADPDGAAGARGVAYLTELIGRPPDAVDGVDIWTGVSWG